jgi:FkbM family methyltransferase
LNVPDLAPPAPALPWTPTPGAPLAITRARHGLMAYNPHDTYIGRSVERYGEFGEPELDLMRAAVPAGGVVVDVGANIGTHTIAFARHVGPTGMVLAFEPQRIVHNILATNVTLNALSWVHLVHAGVGARRDDMLMSDYGYDKDTNYGAISLQPAERGWPVRVVPLDDYLWLPTVHLVKIDVEGMEPHVLDGARAFVAKYRPVLFVENDRESTSAAVLTRLLDLHYRVYWHVAPLHRAGNWRGEQEDLFPGKGTINVFCIPREREQHVVGFTEMTDPAAPPPVALAPF